MDRMKEAPVFIPAYFGPIDQFVTIAGFDEIVLESFDHYQKQTYRNRQEIYGANGNLKMSIPIKHVPGKNNAHQLLKDVKIENEFKWQREHLRSLQIAYQTAPFFEFFEDDIQSIYNNQFTFLLDFNLACFDLINDLLQLSVSYETTHEYHDNYTHDFRRLATAKRESTIGLSKYDQVFMEKHGYISNLSILDLLFNLGNEAGVYLKNQAKKLDAL